MTLPLFFACAVVHSDFWHGQAGELRYSHQLHFTNSHLCLKFGFFSVATPFHGVRLDASVTGPV